MKNVRPELDLWTLDSSLSPQEALLRREEQLRLSLKAAGQGLYDLDLRTGHAEVSPEYATMIGFDPATFEETNAAWRDRLHPDDRHGVYRTFEDYVAGLLPSYEVEFRQRTKSGEWLWTLSSGSVVEWDPDGRPIRMVGTHTNIDARKRAEVQVRASEARLNEAQRLARIGDWELDHVTGEHRWSQEMYRLFELEPGTPVEPAVTKRLVHPDDLEKLSRAFSASIESRRPLLIVHRLLLPGGRVKWVEAHAHTEYTADGRPRTTQATLQDVTARVRADEALRASLREKDVLLREIHHRVKNNLQIVSSLLRFHANEAESPGVASAFADIRQRLRSMTLLHDKLYASENMSAVDFGDYVSSLVAQIDEFRFGVRPVRFVAQTVPLRLPIGAALPAGMVLVELLTNVQKHAFPDGDGEARVRVERAGDGGVRLEVTDSGVGLPPTFDPRATASFGWRLISSLVEQLNGLCEVDGRHGTRVSIWFPVDTALDRDGGDGPSPFAALEER